MPLLYPNTINGLFKMGQTPRMPSRTVGLLAVLLLFAMPGISKAQMTSACPAGFSELSVSGTSRMCEFTATLTDPFTGRPSQSAEGQRLINDAATECRRVGTFSDGGDRGSDGVFVMCRVPLTQDEIDAMQPDEPDPQPTGPTAEELAEQERLEQERRQEEARQEAERQEEAARNAPLVFDIPEAVQADPVVSSLASGLVSVCEGFRQSDTLDASQNDLLERCIDLNREADGAIKLSAIGQIAGRQYTDIGQSINFLNSIQVGNIGGRLAAIKPSLRQNSRDVANSDRRHPNRGLFANSAHRQVGGAAGDTEDLGRWGAFLLGTRGDGDKEASQLSRGFDYQSQSMTFGVDYLWDPTMIVGLAYGYGDTESNFSANSGMMDIRTDTLTAYLAKALKNQWTIDVLFGFGDATTDNLRNMDFTAFGTTVEQTARSQIKSDQSIVSMGLSKGLYGWLDVDLSARVNYVRTDSDRFAEEIDGTAPGFGLALELDSNRIESLTSDLSISLSKSFSTSWGVIIPQSRFSWVREFEDGNRFMTGRFLADTSTLDFTQSGVELGAPGSRLFRVPLEQLDQSYGNILLGVNLLFPRQLSVNASLNKTIGITGFDHTYWSLNARKDF